MLLLLQGEARQLCVKAWASPLGMKVLKQLSSLYRALVWEGFIVLAKASEKETKTQETKEQPPQYTTTPPQDLTTPPKYIQVPVISKLKDDSSNALVQTLKSFTPLLTVTSRVGRALAELMSILVRICSTPLHRPIRRGPGSASYIYVPPSEEAIAVCMEMTQLLYDSLTWDVPVPSDTDDINNTVIKEWLFSG